MKKNRRPFFGRRFFSLMKLFKNSKDSEEGKLARSKIRTVYASKDEMTFPLGEKAKKRRIREEVERIIRSKKKKTSSLKKFHTEFLGREAG